MSKCSPNLSGLLLMPASGFSTNDQLENVRMFALSGSEDQRALSGALTSHVHFGWVTGQRRLHMCITHIVLHTCTYAHAHCLLRTKACLCINVNSIYLLIYIYIYTPAFIIYKILQMHCSACPLTVVIFLVITITIITFFISIAIGACVNNFSNLDGL